MINLKMPEPQFRIPVASNAGLGTDVSPITSILYTGAYSADQLKQFGRDVLEQASKEDWVEIMREGSLVTWGDAGTLGYRVVERLRALIKDIQ